MPGHAGGSARTSRQRGILRALGHRVGRAQAPPVRPAKKMALDCSRRSSCAAVRRVRPKHQEREEYRREVGPRSGTPEDGQGPRSCSTRPNAHRGLQASCRPRRGSAIQNPSASVHAFKRGFDGDKGGSVPLSTAAQEEAPRCFSPRTAAPPRQPAWTHPGHGHRVLLLTMDDRPSREGQDAGSSRPGCGDPVVPLREKTGRRSTSDRRRVKTWDPETNRSAEAAHDDR